MKKSTHLQLQSRTQVPRPFSTAHEVHLPDFLSGSRASAPTRLTCCNTFYNTIILRQNSPQPSQHQQPTAKNPEQHHSKKTQQPTHYGSGPAVLILGGA